jgi:glycosyltransferase involved in cell wall biosynthesis
VGRLEPHKGIRTLLRAAELADCSVLAVGRGSLAPLVREAQRKRPGRVTHIDWVDHDRLPALLHRMHVLALPSIEVVQRNVLPWIGVPLREQFGRVLVEAMACGVPVVGSDLGEIPYVIGAAGRTFPPGDATALAMLLRTLADDPALAERLSRAGRERAMAFGWDRVADAMVDVWSGLLDEPWGTRLGSVPAPSLRVPLQTS